ncbi:hypothetical protein DdX_22058 [Ditylenchus destructor]|uniref:Uncharacterized protein n=1 Tax=Ditylenchus destructor TaxID=166010 RepID=A0AAD4QV05_9BILA|nr:hypothetical protein DdX_22058 [Ditylenchus destructor]
MWWLKHEGQVALDKKLAALEELKASGSVTVESAKTDADMDKACIKGWGMWSAYYHMFDVDQPNSKKVPCYTVNGTRTEDELYTVNLTTTLFSEMVQVEAPRCAHINYAAAFPKAYLSGMKWAMRVFSAFHDPDTNAKVMKAGEHIAPFANMAMEKYKNHDVKGYLTELKNSNEKLQKVMTSLEECIKEEESMEAEDADPMMP